MLSEQDKDSHFSTLALGRPQPMAFPVRNGYHLPLLHQSTLVLSPCFSSFKSTLPKLPGSLKEIDHIILRAGNLPVAFHRARVKPPRALLLQFLPPQTLLRGGTDQILLVVQSQAHHLPSRASGDSSPLQDSQEEMSIGAASKAVCSLYPLAWPL